MGKAWALVAGGALAVLGAGAFSLHAGGPPVGEVAVAGVEAPPAVSRRAVPTPAQAAPARPAPPRVEVDALPEELAPLFAVQAPHSRLARVLQRESLLDAAHFPGEWLPPPVESEAACAALEEGEDDTAAPPRPLEQSPSLRDYDWTAE